jgi:CHAT domain-containing protein
MLLPPALVLSFVIALPSIASCGVEKPLDTRLATAQGRWRATVGRLEGLRYAPYDSRGVAAARATAIKEAKKRRYETRGVSIRGSGPNEQADTALLELLAGDPAAAVSRLIAVIDASPRAAGPTVWNALAVTYLERAHANADPLDLVLALEACARALDSAPGMVSARFNLALALEELSLPGAAAAAWKDYITLDPSSAWADEGRSHRTDLLARRMAVLDACQAAEWKDPALANQAASIDRLVGRCPDRARIYTEEELLPSWADDSTSGRIDAASRKFQLIQQIGLALARRGLDLMIADVAAAAERSHGHSTRRHALERGLKLYRSGQAHSRERQPGAAASAFTRAATELLRAQSPFSEWAIFQHTVSLCYLNKYAAASGELRGIALRLPERYPVLRGRVERMLGLICIVHANPGTAVTYYQAGLAESERGQDLEGLATLHAHMAESISFIGDTRTAWEHRRAALALAATLPDSTKAQTVIDEAAEAALRRECPHAARLIQDEALAVAVRLGDPLAIYAGLLRRIPIDRRLEDWPALEADRAKAFTYARQISEPELQHRMEGELEAAYGDAQANGRAATAAKAYARAIAILSGIGYRYPLVGLFAAHARASEHIGDFASAAEDLRAGLSEVDRQRSELATPEERRRFLEQARELFDAAVSFSAGRLGDNAVAFQFAELGRSRSLLDATATWVRPTSTSSGQSPPLAPLRSAARAMKSPVWASPFGLTEARCRLAPSEILLEYSVLEDRLLRWTIERDGSRFSEIPLSSGQLESKVRMLRSALEHPQDQLARRAPGVARELYRFLIPESLFTGGGVKRLVIVPDRQLNSLPFSALADPQSGRFLIEQTAVVVAPSATYYLHKWPGRHTAADRTLAARSGLVPALSALVIGDPELGPLLRERFPSLPGAREEAQQIAALYPRSRLLVGRAATKHAFLDAARDFDVIHFAGHAGSASDDPLLFLAGTNFDQGLLRGSEIEGMKLQRNCLVVLAACRSGTGSLSASEGPMSAARAFLAAGASTVIASLFNLDDIAAPTLLGALHRLISAGADPAAALRAAQLEAIAAMPMAQREQRFAWAGFQVVSRPVPERTHSRN